MPFPFRTWRFGIPPIIHIVCSFEEYLIFFYTNFHTLFSVIHLNKLFAVSLGPLSFDMSSKCQIFQNKNWPQMKIEEKYIIHILNFNFTLMIGLGKKPWKWVIITVIELAKLILREKQTKITLLYVTDFLNFSQQYWKHFGRVCRKSLVWKRKITVFFSAELFRFSNF